MPGGYSGPYPWVAALAYPELSPTDPKQVYLPFAETVYDWSNDPGNGSLVTYYRTYLGQLGGKAGVRLWRGNSNTGPTPSIGEGTHEGNYVGGIPHPLAMFKFSNFDDVLDVLFRWKTASISAVGWTSDTNTPRKAGSLHSSSNYLWNSLWYLEDYPIVSDERDLYSVAETFWGSEDSIPQHNYPDNLYVSAVAMLSTDIFVTPTQIYFGAVQAVFSRETFNPDTSYWGLEYGSTWNVNAYMGSGGAWNMECTLGNGTAATIFSAGDTTAAFANNPNLPNLTCNVVDRFPYDP